MANEAVVAMVNTAYNFAQSELRKRIDDPDDPTDDEKVNRILAVTELGQRIMNVFLDGEPNNTDQLLEVADKMLAAGISVDDVA